jgi:hypothetical protein
MTDLTGRRVLDVVPCRDTASELKLWASLLKEQVAGVHAVAMDMGAYFIAATHQAARTCRLRLH